MTPETVTAFSDGNPIFATYAAARVHLRVGAGTLPVGGGGVPRSAGFQPAPPNRQAGSLRYAASPTRSCTPAARWFALVVSLVSAGVLFAQVAPAPSPTAPGTAAATAKEEPIVLSPFEVVTSSDVGYEARDTLSGSRLNTSLKDVASQVQVMTPEFLKDLGITDLNDAIAYSLNVETAAQTYDVTSTNNAGNEGSIQAFAGAPRTRGLTGTTIGRDFFQTYIPVDSYNTERFTFAPGANNMLFGNSTPAGSIDTTTKRARADRTRLAAEYRFDNLGSQRTVLDLNQPILKHRLALRWVGLRDRTNSFREPSFRDQNRSFLAATFAPFQKISLRGWYEDYDEHGQPVRNTLLKDRASAWIAAGRPAFDNTVLTGGATVAAPRIRIPTARTNPYYFMDGNGGIGGKLYPMNNTFQTVGQQTLGVVPDNFDASVIDESLIPRHVANAGNAVQNLQRGRTYGGAMSSTVGLGPA